MMRLICCLLLVIAGAGGAAAQSYQPQKLFAAPPYPRSGNAFRSANGGPGQNYWQNKADYTIDAVFDTATRILSGTVVIAYENNSPDALSFLWLALDQNVERPTSMAHFLKNPLDGGSSGHKGFQISEVAVSREGGHWEQVSFVEVGTRMQLRLQQPLAGSGSDLRIRIRFSFRLLATSAAGRGGILNTRNGPVYQFAFWFPRMCVYDDLRGWNTLPFRGSGEFYLEYGDIDYTITAPAGLIMAGAGRLMNAEAVLNNDILTNLRTAATSDTTFLIRPEAKLGKMATRKTSGNVTWHYQMKQTRDVAFALSKAFIWDGRRVRLPNGKIVVAQSFYPVESIEGTSEWDRATEFLAGAIQAFSRRWAAYPYDYAVNVAGKVGGMEFPGLTFDYYQLPAKILWVLVAHEIGHTWFPMMVGSNERRYPFMDEGFNTFIDIYAQEDFHDGVFAPKRDGEYAPGGGNPADEIVAVIDSLQDGPTLMTAPDRMNGEWVHPLAYFKAAFGLVLLREVILGSERFDYAFKNYIQQWAFKHPAPADFFRSMENGSGADLTWFWRGWFYHNWALDQAVTAVNYPDDDPTKGADVTIVNKKRMAMPVPVTVTEANGTVHRFQLPVAVWEQQDHWQFHVPSTSPVRRVVLDERHQLPDRDRSNNIWTAGSLPGN